MFVDFVVAVGYCCLCLDWFWCDVVDFGWCVNVYEYYVLALFCLSVELIVVVLV